MAFSIDLSGKVVLITGVSSGIGAGIARMFAKANANIAGCALEPENHPNIITYYNDVGRETGMRPFYYQCDLTDAETTKKLVDLVYQRYGRIDILASNAGTNYFKGVSDCTDDEWNDNMQINLTSHWNVVRACRPYLSQSESGVIIINSSCHAFNTTSGSFPYNLAKTALKAMVQSLTVEWSPSIRTVGVAPGYIETNLAKKWFDSFPDPQAEYNRTKGLVPLNRLGTPDEIGGWFVFLASDYSAFASGQTFLIDGGCSAVMM